MKYTKEYLLDAAREFIKKKTARDPNVSAVLLIGSLRNVAHFVDHPIDIDLLVLCDGQADLDHELIWISDDHHLDVHYDDASAYEDPKNLRGDSLRGWALWDATLLYQREHFFEFSQSTVRSHFDEPRNVIDRIRYFAKPAREFWLANYQNPAKVSFDMYLSMVLAAGNAVACIKREPLSIRNFLSELLNVTAELEIEDINSHFLSCLSPDLSVELIQDNLEVWETLFIESAKYPGDSVVTPVRLNYFKSAIHTQLSGSQPVTGLWPFLFTLANMGIKFSEDKALINKHSELLTTFGFTPDGMKSKFKALDVLLEDIESIIDQLVVDYTVE